MDTILIPSVVKALISALAGSRLDGMISDDLVRKLLGLPAKSTDLEQDLQKALASLQSGVEAVATLQQKIKEQKSQLEKAIEEHDHFRKLAETNREQAAALLTEIDRRSKGERWFSFFLEVGVNGLFFLIGVFCSDTVRAWWTSHPK